MLTGKIDCRHDKLTNSPMDRGAPCPVCSSMTHTSIGCTELRADLKGGFYSPPSGYRDEGDEEEDAIRMHCVKEEHSR